MGCGSSTSLDVPSSSSQYKYIVEETWQKVSKTLMDKTQSGPDRQLVIRRSGWKTIRIFVSSTFKDFHAEREVLVKEVFPDLRQWCEKRRLHLVECDLRWGIPKDTTSADTLRACLGEIDRCYDDNIMPFFLNLTSERAGWIPTHQDVPQSLVQEYRWVHGLSVTEMEIMHGAYRIDNPNSIFMIRSTKFIDSLPAAHKDDFIDANPIASHKLDMLKNMLRARLGSRVHWYDCEFAGVDGDGKIMFSGLQESFSKLVFDFFKERISYQYPLTEVTMDPFQQTKEAHESFLKSRSPMVLGRVTIFEEIQSYILQEGTGAPLVLSGGAGTGKTSIMARVGDVAQTMTLNNRIPGGGEKGWHVFYHFVGAVPGSTDLEMCLKRLLKELNLVNESTMPVTMENTCQLMCSVLSNAKTQPTIIVIDALNQFDEDLSQSLLSWLPLRVAPQIRVVLSMIDDTPPHRELHERTVNPIEIPVTPLVMETRKSIVTEMLGRYNKKLDEAQMATLLAKESSQNPLWLSVACEELRVYGHFEKLTDKINTLKDGLFDLLMQVFQRFEEENGGKLLVATLCLLECSVTGLLETELLSILGDEDNLTMPSGEVSEAMKDLSTKEKSSREIGTLPAAKWAVVYRALKPFIRPFGDSGEGRLDFYHRAVSKAVRRMYFSGADKDKCKQWWHTKLAKFFMQTNSLERKIEELPSHLLQIGDQESLTKVLTDWTVFEQLFYEEYSVFLLKYWREGFGENWQDVMLEHYGNILAQEAELDMDMDTFIKHVEQISRIATQSGRHNEAMKFLQKCLNLEESRGNRKEKMVEYYHLGTVIYDQVVKTQQYQRASVVRSQCMPLIRFARQSIAIRETLSGDKHKYKLGKILIHLAFNLQKMWEIETDMEGKTPEELREEGQAAAERAYQIFQSLGNVSEMADCIMTKAVLELRGSDEQLELFYRALDLSLQANGEYSVLTSRCYLNIGICNQSRHRNDLTYEYFLKWRDVCEMVFGKHHPRTQRAYNSLQDPRLRQVALLKRQEEQNRIDGSNVTDER
ncbi:telomerase protein component 1-like [Diadema setosum]|uniref:telomerase protein component 1-like n=1 Tax=Diadema setosum TaxID=31175 RepID=UPI003B3A7E5C